ncbi:MAG: TetR/AcrR family transcriptional regulator [Deltaproteobacteria bacterium]|jgi:AcrR family transcriptional regulator|nr:TetR/AcrR family transcriptional regulator [Deltaproteobacteria bacterium]MBW2497097.1 TetR/AcrR family transcriptional regulator [Deltaproteobacteria bacterium]
MIDALDASNDGDVREAEAGREAPEPTRERILDVAEGLFAERGLAGTAVRDIAREAGLTAASLYNHFDGKQALYEAVLARGVQPLFELIEGLGDAEPDEARTGAFLDAILDHLAARPALAKLIQREALTGGDSLSQVAHGWLRPIVAQGLAAMRNRSDSAWSEEEQPLAVAAWIHVILGHFAIAPLLEALFDFDPLAPEQLERQKRFLRHFARLMVSGGEGSDREPGD